MYLKSWIPWRRNDARFLIRASSVGSMDKKKKNVGTGLVGAPACGDVMKLQFEVDENDKVVNACFKTFGCGSAIASSSYGKFFKNYIQLPTTTNFVQTLTDE